MKRYIGLILALTLCVFSPMFAQADSGDDPNKEEKKVVTIELTKLDVNDTTLELSYKIKNNTDHDVWICDDAYANTALLDFEVYLSEDEQTLLIRRRHDVPTDMVWGAWPYARYVLLRSGQDRTESLSLDVPVRPCCVFAIPEAASDHARCLVLEIGFYNEDLPGMIREILEMIEKLNCARPEPSEYGTAFFQRYFKGIWIAHQVFVGGLSGFEKYTYKEGSEEITIPYTRQNLIGEQVLRIEVNGVHIPYEELSHTDGPANGQEEEADVTIALTKLEVTDANLNLSWKVKNNTDHDVWICDNINTYYLSAFETFLAKDAQTLLIRNRFDLPIYRGVIREPPPLRGRYVRLHPGQERTESVSLTIPVGRYREFEGEQANAEYTRRLILEIGFYNEDLRGMILHIVELAKKLNCASGVLSDNDLEIYGRFFGGLEIAGFFNSSSWSSFREFINEGGEEILMPHMELVRMGEQVLRLTVDGVSIPYKGHYQPPSAIDRSWREKHHR